MRFCQSLMFADPGQWVELTRHAEEVGFDQVCLSDHLFYPATLTSKYPYQPDGRPAFTAQTPWPDVWVMVGAMSAVTERIEFLTNIYVLPTRHPVIVAKAVGTAAVLSGGRARLGVGAGWMREEFDLLGESFARRGARMEEQIEVLRTLWRGGMVEHHGELYDFEPLAMAPAPDEPVPILVGGHSEHALRRAAGLADGWVGVVYNRSELRGHLATLARLREEAGTAGRPFETVAAINDALPAPEACAELADMGLDTLITSAWLLAGKTYASLDDNRRALDDFATQYIEPLRDARH